MQGYGEQNIDTYIHTHIQIYIYADIHRGRAHTYRHRGAQGHSDRTTGGQRVRETEI